MSVYSTQVQVDTGQRMVYSLRYRLLQHLQALGLHHHIKTNTGDAVYRVDVDAYAIENLLIGGFPLVTSVATLVVMFAILLKLDVTVALLSLAVVPFLYLSIRYYISTLMAREERVKELESKLVERLYETFSAIRLVKSFAREAHETASYAAAGDRTMDARIALTWQQSLFSVSVTRHHDYRHGARADRRRPARDAAADDDRRPDGRHRVSRRRVRPAVDHRAHDRTAPGRAGRRQAGARDARAGAGDGRTGPMRSTHRRSQATSGSRTSASSIPTAPTCCTTSRSRPGPARWSRSSA